MRFGTPMQQMRDAARKAPVARGVDPLKDRPAQPPQESQPPLAEPEPPPE